MKQGFPTPVAPGRPLPQTFDPHGMHELVEHDFDGHPSAETASNRTRRGKLSSVSAKKDAHADASLDVLNLEGRFLKSKTKNHRRSAKRHPHSRTARATRDLQRDDTLTHQDALDVDEPMPSANDSIVLGNTPVHSDDDGGHDIESVAADRLTDLNQSPTPSRFSHAFSIASKPSWHDDDICVDEEQTWAPVPSDMDLQSTKAAESMAWDAFLNGSGIPETPTSHTPSTSSPSRNSYTERSFARETPTGSPFTLRTKPEIEKSIPCNVSSPSSSILMTRREAQVNQMLDAEVHTVPLDLRPLAEPLVSGLELTVHRRLHRMETLMAQLVQDNRDLKQVVQVVLAASQRLEAALGQRMADSPPTSDSEDGHPDDGNLIEPMIDNGFVQSNGTREQRADDVEFAGTTASDPAENGHIAMDTGARTSSPEAEMQIQDPAEGCEMQESSADCEKNSGRVPS